MSIWPNYPVGRVSKCLECPFCRVSSWPKYHVSRAQLAEASCWPSCLFGRSVCLAEVSSWPKWLDELAETQSVQLAEHRSKCATSRIGPKSVYLAKTCCVQLTDQPVSRQTKEQTEGWEAFSGVLNVDFQSKLIYVFLDCPSFLYFSQWPLQELQSPKTSIFKKL